MRALFPDNCCRTTRKSVLSTYDRDGDERPSLTMSETQTKEYIERLFFRRILVPFVEVRRGAFGQFCISR